ncbi:hypothetical protein [Amycolatopsis sp. NPDC059021]
MSPRSTTRASSPAAVHSWTPTTIARISGRVRRAGGEDIDWPSLRA